MEKMTRKDYHDIELALESVFDTAVEASHIIDPKTRDSLPDEAFGIVFADKDGKTQRKYPLIVKSDPEATKELVSKAIAFFHFAKPDWKAELAKNILRIIRDNKLNVTINKKSQIFKYINEKDLPKTVKIVTTENTK